MHKPGALNKADGLSRRIDHKEGVNDDNDDKIVLDPKKFFGISLVGRGKTTEDPIVARAIRIRTTQAVQLKGDQQLKEQITKCQELDDEVANAIQEIKSNGPRSLGKDFRNGTTKMG
jgi:hypothetical protein